MRLWRAFIDAERPKLAARNIERLESFELISFHARELCLQAANPFDVAWFDEHIRHRFEFFAKAKGHPTLKIALGCAPDQKQELEEKEPDESEGLSPYFTLESFIFPNEPLFDSRSLWLSGAYNPLCFIGPARSGKTHILQALAQAMDKSALYIDGHELIRRYTQSVRNQEIGAFRKWLRGCEALIIDNVDAFANKRASQEELFHAFNALYEKNVPLIFSLTSVNGLESRIKTRLQWGLALPLSPLSDSELIKKALIQKARYFGAENPEEIADYLAVTFPIFEKACSAIEALFLRLGQRRTIAPSEAQLMLKDLIEGRPKHWHSEAIIAAVAAHFGLREEELRGRGKARRLSWPRRVAFALLRRELRLSYPAIGALFGRDHSSVLFALRTADKEKLIEAIAQLDFNRASATLCQPEQDLSKDNEYQ